MKKLQLPTVTLVCADCVETSRAIDALERSKALVDYADVMYFTSLPTDYKHKVEIQHLDHNGYSAFMLKALYQYVKTPHIQVVQHDGWVLNPDGWDNDWLNYDYIGACWLQSGEGGEDNPAACGAGGFSLRSLKLTTLTSQLLPPWDGVHSFDGPTGNNWGHEDGCISLHMRWTLEMKYGCKYAPPSVAAKYCYGGGKLFYCPTSFGFHGFWPENIERLKTGHNPCNPDHSAYYA